MRLLNGHIRFDSCRTVKAAVVIAPMPILFSLVVNPEIQAMRQILLTICGALPSRPP